MGALDSFLTSVGSAIGQAIPKLADVGVAALANKLVKGSGGASGTPYSVFPEFSIGGGAMPSVQIMPVGQQAAMVVQPQQGSFLDFPGLISPLLGGGSALSVSSPWTNAGTPRVYMTTSPKGTPVWFRPAGRPVLFSGDFQACRRVRKVAARARRRLGGR